MTENKNNKNSFDQTVAYSIIDHLVAKGHDTFFGVPGGPVCPIFEAIRINKNAKLVESRHESHAGFSASTFYKTTKKIPVVVITAGPGITNAVNGIASASLEDVPMIVIAGDVAWAKNGGLLAQDSGPEGIHIESIYSSFVKSIIRVNNVNAVNGQLQFLIDKSKNGPTMLIVPIDKAMERYSSEIKIHKVIPSSERGHLEDILRLLENSKRPLLVLGNGCRNIDYDSLKWLINKLKVPFVTTPRAKGLLDEDNKYSLKTCGMGASMWARKYTNDEHVDVCIVLGTDLDDTSINGTPPIGKNGTIVHIDTNPSVFNRNFNTKIGLIWDVSNFANSFIYHQKTNLVSVNYDFSDLVSEVKSSSAFDVSNPDQDSSYPIKPHRVLKDLEKVSNKLNARFITDIGEHMIFCLHYLESKPGNFNIELNLGSMGSGVAGAIGMVIGDKSRPVFCITGDGCMQMSGMEILVAQKEKLPILFVVFNDGRYNMVHHGMKQIFGDAEQYNMKRVNFAYWAASMGLPSMEVTKAGEIDLEKIETLLSYGGPALIDVKIDSEVRVRGSGRIEALQKMSMDVK